ncbi:TIGR03936 family radical SAM-associated protein [Desulfoscipio gibsoniae]|uniref:Radical SAM-linked protein n=1 Tax=Desulfoscipio gibsoniae DSM 7213 TaxID=767817 RepID=R4KJ45_9FIRM|nr:TIGR03936 family radical SAM-associated protein [Desulfoscipio gibsoniae]AGL02639.1 radical SAM-linked protein [Desulfoscipio gibsoniae DSM 7213]
MPRYRIQYSKRGPACYISHLDLVRTLERAFRRAGLPIAFSEGFNPHPRFSFAAPLPVGVEGLAEVLEVDMKESVDHRELAERLNGALPPGLVVLEVTDVPDNAPAPMAALTGAGYIVHLDDDDLPGPLPEEAVQRFLARGQVEVTRKSKDGKKKIRNIRPGILKFDVLSQVNGLTIRLALKTGSIMNVRPEDVIVEFFRYTGITVNKADLQIIRTELF